MGTRVRDPVSSGSERASERPVSTNPGGPSVSLIQTFDDQRRDALTMSVSDETLSRYAKLLALRSQRLGEVKA